MIKFYFWVAASYLAFITLITGRLIRHFYSTFLVGKLASRSPSS